MGFWDEIKTAEVYGKGQYFGAGLFELEVIRCIKKDTLDKGPAFIVELKVLQSSNENHAVGSTGSWYQALYTEKHRYRDMAMGAVKGFALACLGVELSDTEGRAAVSERLSDIMTAATDERNALCGKRVHLETFATKTKEGGDFTQHRFSTYRGT